jgi:hypothetical protein
MSSGRKWRPTGLLTGYVGQPKRDRRQAAPRTRRLRVQVRQGDERALAQWRLGQRQPGIDRLSVHEDGRQLIGRGTRPCRLMTRADPGTATGLPTASTSDGRNPATVSPGSASTTTSALTPRFGSTTVSTNRIQASNLVVLIVGLRLSPAALPGARPRLGQAGETFTHA